MRCEVSPGGRRGVVMFKGEQPAEGGKFPGEGWWLGIKFDEPVGKGDGTAQVVLASACAVLGVLGVLGVLVLSVRVFGVIVGVGLGFLFFLFDLIFFSNEFA